MEKKHPLIIPEIEVIKPKDEITISKKVTAKLVRLTFLVLWTILFLFSCEAQEANASPVVTYKGGYFYLAMNGDLIDDKYYTQDYTAKAAAINMAFACNCVVTIKQPDIQVRVANYTVDDDSISLIWSAPTKREDGSIIEPLDISSYLIHETSEAGSQSYRVIINEATGSFEFNMQTVDTDGNVSKLSNTVAKTVPEGDVNVK